MFHGFTVYAVTTSCSHSYVARAVIYNEVSHLSWNISPRGQDSNNITKGQASNCSSVITANAAFVCTFTVVVKWKHEEDTAGLNWITCHDQNSIPLVSNANCHVCIDIRRNCAKRQFTSKETFRSGSSGSWALRCFEQFLLHSQTLLNTFTAIVDLSRFNNSCLKSPASTLVDLTFQSHALRSFSLNQLRNLSL